MKNFLNFTYLLLIIVSLTSAVINIVYDSEVSENIFFVAIWTMVFTHLISKDEKAN